MNRDTYLPMILEVSASLCDPFAGFRSVEVVIINGVGGKLEDC